MTAKGIVQACFREARKIVADYQVRMREILGYELPDFTCSGAVWDRAEEKMWTAAEKADSNYSEWEFDNWHEDVAALNLLCGTYLVRVEAYCQKMIAKAKKEKEKP